ncbi:MAG: CPBP family intramembrane glutamic endopeptidase [Bacillota bacterium]
MSGEVVLSLGIIYGGMAVHILLLAALLAHSSLAPGSRHVYLSLAIAPMIRILSLSMPLARVPLVYWYVIIGIPVFIAAFVVARLTGYGFRKIGANINNLALQLIFSLSGIGLGYIEYNILRPPPLVENTGLVYMLLTAVILLVFTGFLEELVFRGIMLSALRGLFSDKVAVLMSSTVFAALHITYKVPLDTLFVFVVGLLFSLAVIRFRSILGVSLAHGLTNISMFIVFPFILN